MIRAHLATFPPRRAAMLEVVRRIAPQVDHLFICLNEYQDVPEELEAFENVTCAIPEDNLRDVGKFYFEPAPDDWVITIDDDLAYADDYVARFIEMSETVDMDRNVLGYMGLNAKTDVITSRRDHNLIGFRRNLGRFLGVDVLGTGTAFFKGSNFPTLEYMYTSKCFVDVRAGQWCIDKGLQCWMVPRAQDYLNILDDTFDRGFVISTGGADTYRIQMRKELGALFGKNDHVNARYFQYTRGKRQAKTA